MEKYVYGGWVYRDYFDLEETSDIVEITIETKYAGLTVFLWKNGKMLNWFPICGSCPDRAQRLVESML